MESKREEIANQILDLEKNLGRKPIKRDDGAVYQRARPVFGSWNNALRYCGFEAKDSQRIFIPKKYGPNFYYFMGLLVTDGHLAMNILKKKSYQVKIYTSFTEEKEVILRLIRNLFRYDASVRERRTGFTNNLSYEIYISSKELCSLFVSLGIPSGEKSLSIRVPEIIFNENNENIAAFIRGVIDGDGSINRQGIKVCSGSENFLKDFLKLLNNMGISCGRVSCERQRLFNLWVCKHNSLRALRELLYKNAEYFYPRKKNSWFNKV